MSARPFNLLPSNSSTRPIEPVHEGVRFDKDATFYDMSGDKFLIILNQHRFVKTKHFKQQPSTREGTHHDVRRLGEVFSELGFKIIVLPDWKYQDIINYLTAIASWDHRGTSCICVTILTHGYKGGQIFAADRPYPLSELMAIFEKETSLTNRPKLFFVQACRGGSMDAGHTVYLGSTSDCVLTMPATEMHSSEEKRQADSHFLGRLVGFLRDLFKGAGSTDRLDRLSDSVLTVPTHADTLVLYSTVEDHVSYRNRKDGSWMIQALCDIIQNHHEDLDLLRMTPLIHRLVAYEKNTSLSSRVPALDNKKQIPETKHTLTKELKFEAVPR